ncbi:hypothetical protein AAC387_Pa07g3311 [Persea americana]
MSSNNDGRRYSCVSASQTLEWMNAIADFLTPFKPLLNAHVVNFFKDRLWESVDEQWMDCLRHEPVEILLHIPSGIVQEHWPASLKEFVLTSRSLVLPRDQEKLQKVLPDLHVPSLGSVLAQGMNLKKKHEVEILASVISTVANGVGAQTIVDVGAGQGYLAQVLSFEYQLSVIAIDAFSHHGTVTNVRAERIKKHYAAKIRKSQHGKPSIAGNKPLNVPQTVTCHILSSDTLKALTATFLREDNIDLSKKVEKYASWPPVEGLELNGGREVFSSNNQGFKFSLVLAGLHACGDLSVTMLRTFLDCKEVKALVSIGCCYNLLSEQCSEDTGSKCGFPLSTGAKLSALSLGKNALDLACQSAERWRRLTKDAALQNFEVHAFRGAFQMVLHKYYPDVGRTSPSIGRQGKALRRQQLKRVLQSQLHQSCEMEVSALTTNNGELGGVQEQCKDAVLKDADTCKTSGASDQSDVRSLCSRLRCEGSDRYTLFEEFSKSGLCRLGLTSPHEIDLFGIWKEVHSFTELVGPYWSLRAALGPVVETFILLDRLLFLQEQDGPVDAVICPLFDPALSPRNVAIIARRI